MKFKSYIDDVNQIKLYAPKYYGRDIIEKIKLYKNDEILQFDYLMLKEDHEYFKFVIELKEDYCFDCYYKLVFEEEIIEPILRHIVSKPIFDELFYYDKDDLGSFYTKDKTSFKVWAPLAKKLIYYYF